MREGLASSYGSLPFKLRSKRAGLSVPAPGCIRRLADFAGCTALMTLCSNVIVASFVGRLNFCSGLLSALCPRLGQHRADWLALKSRDQCVTIRGVDGLQACSSMPVVFRVTDSANSELDDLPNSRA